MFSLISSCSSQRKETLEKGQQSAAGGGRFRAIIDTVIGNLQLSITNVHIRYEVRLIYILPHRRLTSNATLLSMSDPIICVSSPKHRSNLCEPASAIQDDVSSSEPFALGLTLEKLTAHTVDEDGKQTFATHNPMELLRKVSFRSVVAQQQVISNAMHRVLAFRSMSLPRPA